MKEDKKYQNPEFYMLLCIAVLFPAGLAEKVWQNELLSIVLALTALWMFIIAFCLVGVRMNSLYKELRRLGGVVLLLAIPLLASAQQYGEATQSLEELHKEWLHYESVPSSDPLIKEWVNYKLECYQDSILNAELEPVVSYVIERLPWGTAVVIDRQDGPEYLHRIPIWEEFMNWLIKKDMR